MSVCVFIYTHTLNKTRASTKCDIPYALVKILGGVLMCNKDFRTKTCFFFQFGYSNCGTVTLLISMSECSLMKIFAYT